MMCCIQSWPEIHLTSNKRGILVKGVNRKNFQPYWKKNLEQEECQHHTMVLELQEPMLSFNLIGKKKLQSCLLNLDIGYKSHIAIWFYQ